MHQLPFNQGVHPCFTLRSPSSVPEPIGTSSGSILHRTGWPGFFVYYVNFKLMSLASHPDIWCFPSSFLRQIFSNEFFLMIFFRRFFPKSISDRFYMTTFFQRGLTSFPPSFSRWVFPNQFFQTSFSQSLFPDEFFPTSFVFLMSIFQHGSHKLFFWQVFNQEYLLTSVFKQVFFDEFFPRDSYEDFTQILSPFFGASIVGR